MPLSIYSRTIGYFMPDEYAEANTSGQICRDKHAAFYAGTIMP